MAHDASESLTDEQIQTLVKLIKIFRPETYQRLDKLYRVDESIDRHRTAEFVHYTSAEAAFNVIHTKELWMRNAIGMADYREVQHGFEIYTSFFEDTANKLAFTSALDKCLVGAKNDVLSLFFDQMLTKVRQQTFISCISQHLKDEDQNGRLSMWRAFGGGVTPRVALIFKIPMIMEAVIELGLQFGPVSYHTKKDVFKTLRCVIDNIRDEYEFLKALRPELVKGSALAMLLSGVTCLKHEGFREEREWRAIYSPEILPSLRIKPTIKTIFGIPQTIYCIPLLADLDIPAILDRLIIGPSQYPELLREAFVSELIEAGIDEAVAGQRVSISEIPIRP